MRQQERQARVARVVLEDHRRGELAQQRGHDEAPAVGGGRRVDALEHEGLARLGQLERGLGELVSVRPEQADRDRDVERRLLGLPGRGRAPLRQHQLVAARSLIPATLGAHARRAGLRVPAAELREVAAVCVGHGRDEILAGHRLPVVPLEVQRHAAGEAVAPDQGLQHADDLGALLVDGDGVEVVDRLVGVGPDRMGHRAGILGELQAAQRANVVDAPDRARAACRGLVGARAGEHVGRELLVSKDRQALLERQLEPVAAGHAVAGPVVEVLVRHHRLDIAEVGVGGDARMGEHVLRVEDVQALVLHRAHVEVADGDDHEAIEVELQPVALLVPADRADQRLHRMVGAIEVARLDPDLQQRVAAGLRHQALFLRDQVAGHQRKQVAGLGEWIVPERAVAPVGQRTLFDQVAVRQQHRPACGVRDQLDAVAGHHVGTVGEVGDAPEALGLALRVEAAVGEVQPHQLGVRGWRDRDHREQLERRGRRVDAQAVGEPVQPVRGNRHAVDLGRQQLETLAVQGQRGIGRRIGAPAHGHPGGDPRALRVELEAQVDALDRVVRRGIVEAPDGDRLIGAHGGRTRVYGWPTIVCGALT